MEDPNIGKKMLKQVAGALFKTNRPAKKTSSGSVPGLPQEMTRSRGKHTSRGSYNKGQNAGGSWF